MSHFNHSLRTAAVLTLLALAGTPGVTRADVSAMPWEVLGTLTATASFGGKTTVLKQKASGPWTMSFASDGTVSMAGKGVSLTGTWTQVRNKFQIVLDDTAIASLLSGIQDDALAQSNLRINLASAGSTFVGTENWSAMTLKGLMTIKASILYPDYSAKSGKLTLRYTFTGQMAPM